MADAIAHGTLKGGGRHRQRFYDAEIRHIANADASILQLAKMYKTDPSYIGHLRRAAVKGL